jgi:hypothetical protein
MTGEWEQARRVRRACRIQPHAAPAYEGVLATAMVLPHQRRFHPPSGGIAAPPQRQ